MIVGEKAFVEGVPNRDASRYCVEYLQLGSKLLDLLPEVDVPEKFTKEIGTSEYVKRRYSLQREFEDAIMEDNIERGGDAVKKIKELRDPQNYLRNDFLEKNMITSEIANDCLDCLDMTDRMTYTHEQTYHTINFKSVPKNVVEYRPFNSHN